MTKTERLYDRDAYLTECEAEVLAVRKAGTTAAQGADLEAEDAWEVILDRTVFFPEGGGQSPDTGCIIAAGPGPSAGAQYRVTDVQIRDGVIVHTVAADLNTEGAAAGSCECAAAGHEKTKRSSLSHDLPGIAVAGGNAGARGDRLGAPVLFYAEPHRRTYPVRSYARPVRI